MEESDGGGEEPPQGPWLLRGSVRIEGSPPIMHSPPPISLGGLPFAGQVVPRGGDWQGRDLSVGIGSTVCELPACTRHSAGASPVSWPHSSCKTPSGCLGGKPWSGGGAAL